jgi:hypothetical protein
MAANISAGVYYREWDMSYYALQLATTQFGVVGEATKGPIDELVLITSPDSLIKTYGFPVPGTTYGLYSALQYLREGNLLNFVRVGPGSDPSSNAPSLADATLYLFKDKTTSLSAFTIQSVDEGSYYNRVSLEFFNGYSKSEISNTYLYSQATAGSLDVAVNDEVYPIDNRYAMTIFVRRGGIVYTVGTAEFSDLADDPVFSTATSNWMNPTSPLDVANSSLTLITETVNTPTPQIFLKGFGALTLEFVDTEMEPTDEVWVSYNRYRTFSLNIKAIQSDNRTTNIETYRNLNLDPQSDNFYATILRQSNILAGNTLFFGRLNGNLAEIPTWPVPGVYPFTGGSDGTGIVPADFIGVSEGTHKTGLQIFGDPEELDLNLVAVPGRTEQEIVRAVISLCEQRRDVIGLIDTPRSLSPQQVVSWVDGSGEFADQNSINSSYVAVFYPWIRSYDPYNPMANSGNGVWLPPSGYMSACVVRTDRDYGIQYSPAGVVTGRLLEALEVERRLDQGERDFLYLNRVNPIVDFKAYGVLLWGQKTAQVQSTALDRLPARRVLNYVEKVIVTSLYPLVFQPQTQATWDQAYMIVQPFLDNCVVKGMLRQGKFVCNATTNTPDVIARNEMVANIFVDLPKYAEVITLNFVIMQTGASVEEYVGKNNW